MDKTHWRAVERVFEVRLVRSKTQSEVLSDAELVDLAFSSIERKV